MAKSVAVSDPLIGGIGLAMAGSVLFSGKAIVVKLAYRYGVDAATLIALRMLFAAPIFAIVYVRCSRHAQPLTFGDHLKIGSVGIIGYYGASYLDFLGLQHITAGLERLILYLNPTLVLLLSVVMFARRPGRRDYLAFVVAYAGIAFALWHDLRLEGDNVLLGVTLVFASAVCYAVYLTASGELVSRVGAIRLTAHAMLAATAGVVVQALVVDVGAMLEQPAEVYWLSLVNALFCTVLPVFATMVAVERIGAGKTSIAAMIGPVSTIFFAWILLGEGLSIWQACGTVLVLAGVLLLTQARSA
ncbi:MAG TPA: DMT family transporter [Gammaproteobacteria bacterium]|nr:DMT family transporter [Gammaproteobacteria bacterium]